jgi:lipoprotein signal peptidase
MRLIERQAMSLAVVALVIDLASKQLLLNDLKPGSVVPVIDGLFRLVKAWNVGVSFSILGGDGAVPPWVLSAVAVGICIGLLVWLRRTDRAVTGWGIGLVMGGAIGMSSTAFVGERCSTLPISMSVNGIGRPLNWPTSRLTWPTSRSSWALR